MTADRDPPAYDGLATDEKILAVVDTVRRVSGVPAGRTSATFAPRQVERRAEAPPPRNAAGEDESPRRHGEHPEPSSKRTSPLAPSLGPAARQRSRPATANDLEQRRSKAGRGLLFGAVAALLLHLAVGLALAGGQPLLRADHDAGLMQTLIGHLVEQVSARLPT